MTKKDQIIKMSVIGIIAALVLVFFAIPTISEILTVSSTQIVKVRSALRIGAKITLTS